MNKLTYVIDSILNEKHLDRRWLLTMFGTLPPNTPLLTDYDLATDDKGSFGTIVAGESIPLTSASGVAFLDFNGKVDIKKGMLPNIDANYTTTYGLLIINSILFLYSYRGEIPYQNNELTDKKVNELMYEKLIESANNHDAHLRFENSVSLLTVLTQVGVPSSTRKSLSPNPKTKPLKDKLLKEHAGKLTDPAVVSDIQAALVTSEREYLKGDRSEGFLIKKKSINMVRSRTMGMYGAEPDILDESKISVMSPSLTEGWDVDNMVMLTNTIRAGSFARSQETALGGAEVKVITRIFQNYTIGSDDCFTKNYVIVDINKDNKDKFIGRMLIGGKTTLVKGGLDKFIGGSVKMRSSASCSEPGTSICKVCMGEIVTKSGLGISGHTTSAISSFLGLFMALVHSSELSTKRYNYKDRIT